MKAQCFFALLHAAVTCALWPAPVEIESGELEYAVWLDKVLVVEYVCDNKLLYREESTVRWHSALTEPVLHLVQYISNNAPFMGLANKSESLTEYDVVRRAVHRAISAVRESRFVPWKLHSRRTSFEPQSQSAQRRYLSRLRIQQCNCSPKDDLDTKSFFSSDESYTLSIKEGTADIDATSSLGILHALESFKQLFHAHTDGIEQYVLNAPLIIRDRPKWAHRGLSLDIARNPFTPQDAIRTINGMATVKMNRLHIHATDSQSWPIEVPALPALALKGAYRPDLIWTTTDMEQVQQYGIERGVSVFIEIDMPGHTASVAHAYPELVAAFNELDWSNFAAEPPSGQLKLNSAKVNNFVDTLMHDLLPRQARFTSLYHAGGDEVNLQAYLLDETVKSNDSKVLQPLLQSFMTRIIDHAVENGLQPIVWEEMVLDWNLTLPSTWAQQAELDTLVQVWRSSKRIEEVLKRGYRAIFGDFEHWYLDCGFGGFLDPYPSGKSPTGVPFNSSGGQKSKLKPPYLDYCNPHHNWRHMYLYNPLVNVSDDLHHQVIGGECLMWSEQTDSVDLDTKLWPRAAAAAEVLWSGVRKESMIEDASRRLGEWRERVVLDYGIRASPVAMTWCLMEGGCNL